MPRDIMLVIAESADEPRRWFEDVEPLAAIHCRYCLPNEARSRVFLCRRYREPVRKMWPKLKRYL